MPAFFISWKWAEAFPFRQEKAFVLSFPSVYSAINSLFNAAQNVTGRLPRACATAQFIATGD